MSTSPLWIRLRGLVRVGMPLPVLRPHRLLRGPAPCGVQQWGEGGHNSQLWLLRTWLVSLNTQLLPQDWLASEEQSRVCPGVYLRATSLALLQALGTTPTKLVSVTFL